MYHGFHACIETPIIHRPMNFPSTSLSLLSKLKHPEDSPMWQAS
jgi:hypothetical protein